MHWGHAVSRDLINWRHLPIALYPDEHGMIFSGSTVVDWNNTAGFGEEVLAAVYTCHKDYQETQNLAYSTDRGRSWTKYAGNPVIPHPVPLSDCRDPKVFWSNDLWVMALAAKDRVLFYTSPNLKQWEFSGSFGSGYGSTSGVWETPDLFQLPIDGGSESRWVLMVGVGDGASAGGSGTQYFIGDFDGKSFVSKNPKNTVLWADFGADYYAAQSWNESPNGRRIMLGWLSNWQYAAVTPSEAWRGMFSLPRQMSLTRTADGIRLAQRPIVELQALRGERNHWQDGIINPEENLLAGIRGECLEILAEFELDGHATACGLRVRVGKEEQTTIGYAIRQQTLFFDRTRSGKSDFYAGFAARHTAQLAPHGKRVSLHIFVDRSSVEVFANDGLVTFCEIIFPSASSQGLELFVEGGSVKLGQLDIYHLKPANLCL